MLFRVGIAVFLSIVLIGGATLVRTSQGERAQTLFEVKNSDPNNLDPFSDAYWPEGGLSLDGRILTTSDHISRQIIGDYLNLAGQGNVTEENLTLLANKYVESFKSLSLATEITANDIAVVSNSKENLQAYADTLTEINKEFNKKAQSYVLEDGRVKLNETLYSSAAGLTDAYSTAAKSLSSMKVPSYLLAEHIKLVNLYFQNASAMKSLSETDQDSALSFAGLTVLNTNLQNEPLIINDISRILVENGI